VACGFWGLAALRANGRFVAASVGAGHAQNNPEGAQPVVSAVMATTLRITLLAGTYGAALPPCDPSDGSSAQLDYPPSPWRLLQVLQTNNPDLQPLLARLALHPPQFHLPYGQLESSRRGADRSRPDPIRFGAGAAIHIRWPVDLSAEEERLLSASVADLHWIGRPQDTAIWQVVPTMPEANCVPSADGSFEVLCGAPATADGLQPIRYRFNPSRSLPRPATAASCQANRALFAVSIDEALPESAGIIWTDRLHRALLKRAPGSALFAGLAGGRPLPEDQRAWYRWEATQGLICQLEVVSPQPFEAAELEALRGLRHLFGHGGIAIPLQLLQLDAQPIAHAKRLQTATPMFLYTTPRTGKPHRSPAAQAIQSLLWGCGERGKVEREAFQEKEGGGAEIQLVHPRYGRISALVREAPHQPLLARRGERIAASSVPYHVVLEADHPLPLLGVGWGRHFGAGRLVATGSA